MEVFIFQSSLPRGVLCCFFEKERKIRDNIDPHSFISHVIYSVLSYNSNTVLYKIDTTVIIC